MGISSILLALAAMFINHSLGNHIMEGEREIALRQIEEESTKNSIVTYEKATTNVDALVAKVKTKCEDCEVEVLDNIGALILHYPSSNHPTASEMLNIPGIKHAEEDLVVHMADFYTQERQSSSNPNDPQFTNQWELQDNNNKNADINWQAGVQAYLSDSQAKSDVVVAVIDTGIDYNHPDLKGVMWTNPNEIAGNGKDDDGNGIIDDVYGVDYTSNDRGNPIDRQGHGTHCAGTIAAQANNNAGIAGVASAAQSKVKLMAVKGLSDQGTGATSWLMNGLNYAIGKGAQISSNSWGGRGSDNGVLKDILDSNPGHLFIAAAGNDKTQITDTVKYTTCSTNAATQICVGSTTSSDTMSGFSNYGKPYVHVMAPGSGILSTYPNNRYARLSGTSMACPQVSGLAALLMTMRSNLTPIQVKNIIEQNVQSKSQYTAVATSGGLIDVLASVNAVKNQGSVPTTTTTTTAKPTNQVCTTIKLQTKAWGNEVSWTFGSCKSSQQYANNTSYSIKCCQPAGNYTLTCTDSWHDGWHGGYIEIGSKKYCRKFRSGKTKTTRNVRHG